MEVQPHQRPQDQLKGIGASQLNFPNISDIANMIIDRYLSFNLPIPLSETTQHLN
jgi:hypothetical protein